MDAKVVKIPSRKKIWLVWVLYDSGKLFLRAICTTEACAKHYEVYAKKTLRAWRVMIEPTLTNHYYAGGFDLLERRQIKSEWESTHGR